MKRQGILMLALLVLLAGCANERTGTESNADQTEGEISVEVPFQPEESVLHSEEEQKEESAAQGPDMPQDLQDVDQSELEASRVYLYPILYSSATLSTWDDAAALDQDMLINMYGYNQVWNADIPESEMEWEDEIPYYYVEQSLLEEYITGYLDLPAEHLRAAGHYNTGRQAYAFNMSGVGWAYSPDIIRAAYSESENIWALYLNGGFDAPPDEEAAILLVYLPEDGGHRYLGNVYLGDQ